MSNFQFSSPAFLPVVCLLLSLCTVARLPISCPLKILRQLRPPKNIMSSQLKNLGRLWMNHGIVAEKNLKLDTIVQILYLYNYRVLHSGSRDHN